MVRTAPTLYKAVQIADDECRKEQTRELPHYIYPDSIITAAIVQRWSKYGVEYRLKAEDARKISVLDAQKPHGVSIFGNGFLLSTSAAAERAAAERAAAERAAAKEWKLSEAEETMVALIDREKEKRKKRKKC